MACPLPTEVGDAETIVRAIKTPHHVNKAQSKLRPSAYRPPAGKAIISVMRQVVGDQQCKAQALDVCKDSYLGLAVLGAGNIRQAGSDVLDAPDDYFGHAHVDHGFCAPGPNEPANARDTERMDSRCKALVDISLFHPDPQPNAPGWHGAALLAP